MMKGQKMTKQTVWTCKIGSLKHLELPKAADAPMRDAVQACFNGLLGEYPEFIFSGWGGELDEYELAVQEERVPDDSKYLSEELYNILKCIDPAICPDKVTRNGEDWHSFIVPIGNDHTAEITIHKDDYEVLKGMFNDAEGTS